MIIQEMKILKNKTSIKKEIKKLNFEFLIDLKHKKAIFDLKNR